MRKKSPKLKLVPSAADGDTASSTLGTAGATLWATIQNDFVVADAGSRETLLQICRAADRAEEYAAIINAEGPVVPTKHGLRDHPLCKHELAARSFVVRGLQRLGLEDVKPVGRPGSGGIGWRPPYD